MAHVDSSRRRPPGLLVVVARQWRSEALHASTTLQIFDLETKYLENCNSIGNALIGMLTCTSVVIMQHAIAAPCSMMTAIPGTMHVVHMAFACTPLAIAIVYL